MPPKPTSTKSVDEKNWDDYIKLFEIYASHMVVDEPGIIDGGVVSKTKPEIIETDDVLPTKPWLCPKREEEITEIDDVLPTEPWLHPKTE